jgi:metallophosphoesterase (TIGR00282 family)
MAATSLMRVLMVGDIVGSPGRRAFAAVAARLKEQGKADFVVANAENAAGGKGLTEATAQELFKAGADVLTLGDHTWDQKGFENCLDREQRIVRPANFAPGCPGRGVTTVNTAWCPVTVMNLVGRVFMREYDCPFRTADAVLAKRSELAAVLLVDMHAEATSEKIVMGRHLDGRVTAVVGTHTHVQTSDEAVLPGGTAYVTDLGMTGPTGGALGRNLQSVSAAFVTGRPMTFELAHGAPVVEGVVIDVDYRTGRAVAIERVREQ